jgi:hypothetical protein
VPTFEISLKKIFEKNIVKKITNQAFLAHGLMKFAPTFKKKPLKKLIKNHDKKVCRPIVAFWAHDLTNIQPTF